MNPDDILTLVPVLIEAGKGIFEAIRAVSQGDSERAHMEIRKANALLELEIAKRELK